MEAAPKVPYEFPFVIGYSGITSFSVSINGSTYLKGYSCLVIYHCNLVTTITFLHMTKQEYLEIQSEVLSGGKQLKLILQSMEFLIPLITTGVINLHLAMRIYL